MSFNSFLFCLYLNKCHCIRWLIEFNLDNFQYTSQAHGKLWLLNVIQRIIISQRLLITWIKKKKKMQLVTKGDQDLYHCSLLDVRKLNEEKNETLVRSPETWFVNSSGKHERRVEWIDKTTNAKIQQQH